MLDKSCPSVTVNYTGFSITWNETLAGVTVEAPCTGDNLNGTSLSTIPVIYVYIHIHLSLDT